MYFQLIWVKKTMILKLFVKKNVNINNKKVSSNTDLNFANTTKMANWEP